MRLLALAKRIALESGAAFSQALRPEPRIDERVEDQIAGGKQTGEEEGDRDRARMYSGWRMFGRMMCAIERGLETTSQLLKRLNRPR